MPLTIDAIYPASPSFQTFASRRSTIHSTKGIVSCTQPLAASLGLKILAKGGNAADAAVAVAAGMNLAEPCSTGIGGDMFCLFYDAKSKTVKSLNGSGRAGSKTSLEQVKREIGGADAIPMNSVHAVTVPGSAAGWVDTVEKFGSGKLTLQEILQPAIEMGEQGYPVSELTAFYWQRSEKTIRNASPNFGEMLKDDKASADGKRAPRAGEIFKNPTLANTFRLLAKHGKRGFYEGPVAEALVKVVGDLGGHLTLEDLKNHGELGSQETEAIKLRFKGQNVGKGKGEEGTNEVKGADPDGVDVWEHPPNGQGIVALIALGILEELERTGKISTWKPEDHNSAAHIHAVVEALRIAFADASWWVADPDRFKVPTKEMLSRSYLAERAKIFDPKKASPPLHHGEPSPAQQKSDTVYFAVTDKDGNGASFIMSNYGGFGTAIIPKGCGFTLQNRGANFSLDPGHPNAYAPDKRPYHTIIPAMITNPSDNSLHSVYGVMGGFMQPQGHVQVLLNMLTFHHSPQSAIDAPRVCIGAGLPEQGDVFDRVVYLEEGISENVAKELEAMGHKTQIVSGQARGMFGRGQLIRCHHEDGQVVYSAGSDPRGDGAAFPAL